MSGGGGGAVQNVPAFVETRMKELFDGNNISGYADTLFNSTNLATMFYTNPFSNANSYAYKDQVSYDEATLPYNPKEAESAQIWSLINSLNNWSQNYKSYTSVTDRRADLVNSYDSVYDVFIEEIEGSLINHFLSGFNLALKNEGQIADSLMLDNSVETSINDKVRGVLLNFKDDFLSLLESVKTKAVSILQSIDSTTDPYILDQLANDLNTIFSKITENVDSIIDNAFKKAFEIMADTVVSNAVSAYEQTTRTRYNTIKNRSLGAMRRLSAVNSSSYAIAGMMLDAERQRDVNNFEAKLKLEVMRIVTDMYKSLTGVVSGVVGEAYRVRLVDAKQRFADFINRTFGNYWNMIQASAQMNIGIKQLRAGFVNEAVLSRVRAGYSFLNQLFDNLQKITYQEFLALVDKNKEGRLLDMEQAKVIGEISRLSYAMNQEYRGKLFDRFAGYEDWKLKLLTTGTNMLAAYAGAVQVMPKEPSTAVTMLGGALSGASVGSTIGGPVGAAVGGALGGVLGLLT